MTIELLWDAGPGEVRAGLIEGGLLTEFRIIRPRRGETALLQADERYTARLTEKLGSGQALVDIGGGKQAVMQPVPNVPLGSLIETVMTRGPISEPGQWKLAKVRPLPDTPPSAAEPCWHFSAEPWETFLRDWSTKVDAFLCPNAAVALDVERTIGTSTPIKVDPTAIDDVEFDMVIEAATHGDFPISGGMLKVERTRAMVMIDVDGTAPAHQLNRAAAAEIPRLLRLLDIGGPVGIDFVGSANKEDRLEIGSLFDAEAQALGPYERTAINGYGLCQIIRPRARPSILEILCGTRLSRLSDESRAIALLRAAGRSVGIGTRQLIGPPTVIDLIMTWPEETGALRSALGAEIELVSDVRATGYGQVHVNQS